MAASAAAYPIDDTIRLSATGEVFALRFIEGKSVASKFPGGRVMFTATDGRKLFLNDEEANELERAVRALGIQAGEPLRAARVSLGRGAGNAIRVARVEAQRIEPQRAEGQGAPSWQSNAPAPVAAAPQPTRTAAAPPAQVNTVPPIPPPPPTHAPAIAAAPEPNKYIGAYTQAIDTLIEARAIALAKGLALEVRCEDVRALAATILIDQQRGGR